MRRLPVFWFLASGLCLLTDGCARRETPVLRGDREQILSRGIGSEVSDLDPQLVTGIAERHGRTPAQVILHWHIDSGRSAIPKSVRPHRIAENLDVFGFSMSADEIAAIDALDTGVRGGPNQDELDFRTFNRPIPEA